jgi:hypothetical protein
MTAGSETNCFSNAQPEANRLTKANKVTEMLKQTIREAFNLFTETAK